MFTVWDLKGKEISVITYPNTDANDSSKIAGNDKPVFPHKL